MKGRTAQQVEEGGKCVSRDRLEGVSKGFRVPQEHGEAWGKCVPSRAHRVGPTQAPQRGCLPVVPVPKDTMGKRLGGEEKASESHPDIGAKPLVQQVLLSLHLALAVNATTDST